MKGDHTCHRSFSSRGGLPCLNVHKQTAPASFCVGQGENGTNQLLPVPIHTPLLSLTPLLSDFSPQYPLPLKLLAPLQPPQPVHFHFAGNVPSSPHACSLQLPRNVARVRLKKEKSPSTIKHKAELALQKKYLPQFTKPLTKLLGQPTQFHEWPVHLSAHIVFLMCISFFICQHFSQCASGFYLSTLFPNAHWFF